MDKFDKLEGVAAPLRIVNVDTDMIIPKQYLKTLKRTGLAKGLFSELRYLDNGSENPEFVLNQPAYAGAVILLGGGNFGCGSSREHAAWALTEYGIRAVLAPSFAPIFYGNCVRNGIAPVKLPADVIAGIAASVADNPADNPLTVDLQAMRVSLPDGRHWSFEMGAEQREMLLAGLDAIDLTWKWRTQIENFVAADRKARPWIYLDSSVR